MDTTNQKIMMIRIPSTVECDPVMRLVDEFSKLGCDSVIHLGLTSTDPILDSAIKMGVPSLEVKVTDGQS